MKKALIFYTYLPPWRIDIFNYLETIYDLRIYFTLPKEDGFIYNQSDLIKKLKAKSYFLTSGFKMFGLNFRFGLLSILRKEKPQIVFTHEYSPTTVFLAVFKFFKLFNFKLVITTSDNIEIANNKHWLRYFIIHFVLNISDAMIVYSEGVKSFYSKFKNLQIEVCPNIQNPERIRLLDKEIASETINLKRTGLMPDRFILFVGRLEIEKGVDLLFHAFSEVKINDIKLVVIGKGSQKNNLRQLAVNLKINENIIFIDEIYGVSLYSFFSNAIFLVLPSRYEPFGAVVNEALILGCPVLISDKAGAVQFVLNQFNGYIINVNNHLEFCESIYKILELSSSLPRYQNLMIKDYNEYVKNFYKVGYVQN